MARAGEKRNSVTELTLLQTAVHTDQRENYQTALNSQGELHEHHLSAANKGANFGSPILRYSTSDVGDLGRNARRYFGGRGA